jgi:hypothetical protein
VFLAGCYDKPADFDDSDGDLEVFVVRLHGACLRARQAASVAPDETAELRLDQAENDPYGFADDVDEQTLQMMDVGGFAAFERLPTWPRTIRKLGSKTQSKFKPYSNKAEPSSSKSKEISDLQEACPTPRRHSGRLTGVPSH